MISARNLNVLFRLTSAGRRCRGLEQKATRLLGATLQIFAVTCVLAGCLPELALAQEDSVTVQAGARYSAGDFKRFFLGSGYRDLWTTPIRVPILSPDTFAGGVTVLERGGGRQTASLRFGDKDGREYVFRSVDKDQETGMHPDLHDTLIGDIVQDQVAAKHPGAALSVPPLLDAVGILHATPTLAVLDNHPILGEHEDEFAGMLGLLEERPTEHEGAGPFGKYERLISTETLLERLEESPEDRVDARQFLTARLVDLMIGDWDRHEDQWRWAQTDHGDVRIWLPIPRDRDNAFSSVEGVVGFLGQAVRPFVLPFRETYPDLEGLTYNARALDRRILPELPAEVWDSIAMSVQARLTDAVIAEALESQPPPYHELRGAELERKLRARRDAIPAVAREFYARLMSEVDIRATDEDEVAEVERQPGGATVVRLATEERGVYYERTFVPQETRDIRVFLHGGADSAVVSGVAGEGPTVRLIGGGGDDHLEDRTPRGSARTVLYDDDGDNVFVTAPHTGVDTRPFQPPVDDTLTQNNQPPPRDWGTKSSTFTPGADWRSEVGPVLSGGPSWTRYGFRRFPYASRRSITLFVAPFRGRFAIEGELHRVKTGGEAETRLVAGASQLEQHRFHGFGNESPLGSDPDRSRVWSDEYYAAVELIARLSPRTVATVAPTVRHFEPDPYASSPAAVLAPPGSSAFTLGGLRGSASYDGRDSESYPTDGFHVLTELEWYPAADGVNPFARTALSAATYFPLPIPLEPVIAVRAGGAMAWGAPPFQFAPWIGGSSTVRGYRTGRFRGDASLFGNAELRFAITNINLLLTRGDLGIIALADAGRVYFTPESSDQWHTSAGGGFWFGPIDRKFTGHVLLVGGERPTLIAGIGLPF